MPDFDEIEARFGAKPAKAAGGGIAPGASFDEIEAALGGGAATATVASSDASPAIETLDDALAAGVTSVDFLAGGKVKPADPDTHIIELANRVRMEREGDPDEGKSERDRLLLGSPQVGPPVPFADADTARGYLARVAQEAKAKPPEGLSVAEALAVKLAGPSARLLSRVVPGEMDDKMYGMAQAEAQKAIPGVTGKVLGAVGELAPAMAVVGAAAPLVGAPAALGTYSAVQAPEGERLKAFATGAALGKAGEWMSGALIRTGALDRLPESVVRLIDQAGSNILLGAAARGGDFSEAGADAIVGGIMAAFLKNPALREARGMRGAERALLAEIEAAAKAGEAVMAKFRPQAPPGAVEPMKALPEPSNTPEGPAIPMPERVSYTDAEEIAAIRARLGRMSPQEQEAISAKVDELAALPPEKLRGMARGEAPEPRPDLRQWPEAGRVAYDEALNIAQAGRGVDDVRRHLYRLPTEELVASGELVGIRAADRRELIYKIADAAVAEADLPGGPVRSGFSQPAAEAEPPKAATLAKPAPEAPAPPGAIVEPAPRVPPEAVSAPEAPAPRSLMGDPEAGFVGMGGGGAGRGVGGLRDAAAFPFHLAAEQAGPLRRIFGEVAGRVRGQAGPIGDRLYRFIGHAISKADTYFGEVRDAYFPALKATQGGLGGAKSKAERATQEPAAKSGEAASYRGRELLEGRATPANDAERAIVEAGQRLLAATWNAQVRRKFTRTNKEGVEEPMQQLDGPGKVLPYVENDLAAEVWRTGKPHVLWNKMRAGLKALNADATDAQIDAYMERRNLEANDPMPVGAEGHMASEFSRTMRLPSYLNDGGTWVPIEEVRLHQVFKRLVEGGSYRVGAQEVFGRGSQSKVAKAREAFRKAHGNDDDFVMAMRATFGMNPTPGGNLQPRYGTYSKTALDAYRVLADTSRASSLTASPIYNTPETLSGKAADRYGVGHALVAHAEAFGDVFTFKFTGKHTKSVQKAIDAGVYHEGIADWTTMPGGTTIGNAFRTFGQIVRNYLSMPVNKMQSKAAAILSVEEPARFFNGLDPESVKAEQMATRLKAYAGVEPEEFRALLRGDLPPERVVSMLKTIMDLGPKLATGDSLHPAQKSVFEQHEWTKTLTRFVTWASNHARVNSSRITTLASEYSSALAGKGLTPQQRATRGTAVAMEMGRFLLINAFAGASVDLLTTLTLGDEKSWRKTWERFKQNPASFLAEGAFWNMLAGPYASLARGMIHGRINMRSIFPVAVVEQAVDVVGGMVKSAVQGRAGPAVEAVGEVAPLLNVFGDTKDKKPRGMGINARPR